MLKTTRKNYVTLTVKAIKCNYLFSDISEEELVLTQFQLFPICPTCHLTPALLHIYPCAYIAPFLLYEGTFLQNELCVFHFCASHGICINVLNLVRGH